MKKVLLFSAALLIAFVLSLPVIGQGEKEEAKRAMPAADGAALWKHMTTESPYLGWGLWPGHIVLHKGKSPHGEYIRVLANPIAMAAFREGKSVMPEGAIIMKENYNNGKQLVALTPMYKVKGYNPEGGDWFWVKYAPDGTVLGEGKMKGCIDCHAKVKKNKDWIFHTYKQ